MANSYSKLETTEERVKELIAVLKILNPDFNTQVPDVPSKTDLSAVFHSLVAKLAVPNAPQFVPMLSGAIPNLGDKAVIFYSRGRAIGGRDEGRPALVTTHPMWQQIQALW